MNFFKNNKVTYILGGLLLGLGYTIFRLNNSLLSDALLDKIILSFGESMDENQLDTTRKLMGVFQFASIFIFLVRGIVIASLMKLTTYLIKGYQNISFRTLLNISFIAESVFIISDLWTYLHLAKHPDNVNEFLFYKPLSIINTFDYTTIDKWLVSLYQSINLFEALYIIILTVLLVKVCKKSFLKNLEYILVSYIFPYVSFLSIILFLSYES